MFNETFLSTFPLRGTSPACAWTTGRTTHFYPRSPCGERRTAAFARPSASPFLSTFPLRGTSIPGLLPVPRVNISIHVPLAGNVVPFWRCTTARKHFYPRSPCGERPLMVVVPFASPVFLSTFPLRGTSVACCASYGSVLYFYPRSPCGERHAGAENGVDSVNISIHVPLAGNV